MRRMDEQGTPPSATSRSQTPRPALSWLALGGAVLVFVLLARSLTAYPLKPLGLPNTGPAGASPTIVASQQDSGVPGLTLQHIAMVSATKGWASGRLDAVDGTGTEEQVLLSWNGVTWTRVTTLPDTYNVSAIAALPTGDVWVATGFSIYHLVGDIWQTEYVGANGDTYANISSLDMLSPTEGWAAGYTSDSFGPHGFILRYQAGGWTSEKTPEIVDSTIMISISVTSDEREGWAVGSRYQSNGDTSFALHYLNGAWFEEDAGLPGGAEGVAVVSEGNAWAVGITSGTGPGYIEHYSSGVWQGVTSPTPNQLHAITMFSADEGYIAGDGAATLHYVHGAWQQEGLVIHQTLLSGIAMTAPGEGWAVGGAVMLREHGGVWSVWKLSL